MSNQPPADILADHQPYLEQIERLVQASQSQADQWPAHLSDPNRILIAAMTLRKELFKLSSAELQGNHSDDQFLDLWAQSVISWIGPEKTLSPIHDFWNIFADWMLGLKLKRLIKYISAENITWSLAEINIDDLSLFWMNSLEAYPEVVGPRPWKIGRLRQQLADHPQILDQLREVQLPYHQAFARRTQDPILVLEAEEDVDLEANLGRDRYRLPDGNGRVFDQLLYGDTPTLTAWVGHLEGQRPRNFWVSTGSLRVLAESYYEAEDETVRQASLTLLRDLFRQSSVARINFELRCASRHPALWDLLK